MQDENDKRLAPHELEEAVRLALHELEDAERLARQAEGKGCVYVMAVRGIEAVRIGRTVDLPQRLRWFEYKNFPVEVILLGKCNVLNHDAKRAEEEIFQLLDDIHLRRRNPKL